MALLYQNAIADLYRQQGNPWLTAKQVATGLPDETMRRVAVQLSYYVSIGALEKRYQRPKTEYRFRAGKLEQEASYTKNPRVKRARLAMPSIRLLEDNGFNKAAEFLRDTYGI